MQQLYQQSRLRSRKISNAEHAALVASMPLMCQPGAEWNYSRSTDILGRIIEVVSGKSLSAFLTERILAPLQMAETAFHTGEENAGRLAEPFANDPWTGDKVQLFNMLEKPVMESGGGGLRFDHHGLCAVQPDAAQRRHARRQQDHRPQDAGADGVQSSRPERQGRLAADAGRPRFWPRLRGAHRTAGMAPFPGSVGQFFWSGMAGTFFWIDPAEDMFAVFMMQGPGQREYIRSMLRNLVYAAVE